MKIDQQLVSLIKTWSYPSFNITDFYNFDANQKEHCEILLLALQQMQSNKTIRTVNLLGAELGDEWMAQALKILKECQSVTEISIVGNLLTDNITDDLKDFIISKKEIKTLLLHDNMFSESKRLELLNLMEKTHTVHPIGLEEQLRKSMIEGLIYLTKTNKKNKY